MAIKSEGIIGPSEEDIKRASSGDYAPRGLMRLLLRLAKNWPLRIALAGAASYAAYKHVPAVKESIDSLGTNLADRWNTLLKSSATSQNLQERPLGPQPSEVTNWWQELSTEQIKNLAIIPDVNQIGERYQSTVSPTLQKRAEEAGYKLIYQANPDDTVGRSVVAKGREPDAAVDWTSEDLGFGRAGLNARGILKAWVPDPEDPTQKKKVYALLEDPVAKKQYVVGIDLTRYDSTKSNKLELPTFFAVDDLKFGPGYISDKTKAAGRPSGILGYQVPDSESPASKKWKKIGEDFSEVYQWIRFKGYNLSNLARPGDYVSVNLKWTGGISDGQHILVKDENGAGTAVMFVVKRFEGFKQLQAEKNSTP